MPIKPCPPKLARALREIAFDCATLPVIEADTAEVVARKARKSVTRRVSFHVDGSLQTIGRVPDWADYEGAGVRGDRKAITEFTKRARNNFIRSVASVDCQAHVLLGTLTYPLQFSTFPQIWKDDLDKWGKRLLRKYPQAGCFWKLEAQERGAPHFHLLIFSLDHLDKHWLAASWSEAVGSGCDDHGKAGTKIEHPRQEQAAVRYACKSYITKAGDLPDFWKECGRLWGAIGRKNIPRSRVLNCDVSEQALFRYRRIVGRWHESCGRKKLGAGTQSVFGVSHIQWLRALALCEGFPFPQMFMGPHVGRPFPIFVPREGTSHKIESAG